MHFSIIAAIDAQHGIGRKGTLTWRLKQDLEHFRKLTVTPAGQPTNVVIMGRRTWESLPEKFRPLPDRLNIVLSQSREYVVPDGVLLVPSFDQALKRLADRGQLGQVFVIGGGMVYQDAIQRPECDCLYLTEIDQSFDCDAFFPSRPEYFQEISRSPRYEEHGLTFSFVTYGRRNQVKRRLE